MKIIRIIFFSLIILGCLFISCSKRGENTFPECKVENPLEELEWIKSKKNSCENNTCKIAIMEALYKGKTVFFETIIDPLCSTIFHVVLWDCNGNIVKEYSEGEGQMFTTEVEYVKELYRCED